MGIYEHQEQPQIQNLHQLQQNFLQHHQSPPAASSHHQSKKQSKQNSSHKKTPISAIKPSEE
jgi:hypothetical protein